MSISSFRLGIGNTIYSMQKWFLYFFYFYFENLWNPLCCYSVDLHTVVLFLHEVAGFVTLSIYTEQMRPMKTRWTGSLGQWFPNCGSRPPSQNKLIIIYIYIYFKGTGFKLTLETCNSWMHVVRDVPQCWQWGRVKKFGNPWLFESSLWNDFKFTFWLHFFIPLCCCPVA